MNEPNGLNTQITIEDRFSKTFTTLNSSLNGAIYTSQNFGNAFGNSIGAATNSMLGMNSAIVSMNSSYMSGSPSILDSLSNMSYYLSESRSIINDLGDAFNVLNRHLNEASSGSMSLSEKLSLAYKVTKKLGIDGYIKLGKGLLILDKLKGSVSDFLHSMSYTMEDLADKSTGFVNDIKPLVKLASHFCPFLRIILPYLDRIPDLLRDTSGTLKEMSSTIDKVNIPAVGLLKKLVAFKEFISSTAGKVILFSGSVLSLGTAFGIAFLKSEKFRMGIISFGRLIKEGFKEDMEFIKGKMIYLDISMQMASKGYSRFREHIEKFGKLDGSYFFAKNSFEDMKKAFLKSNVGLDLQFKMIMLKKKLDELDTELMWHFKTYARFRNQMMEKGFWGAIAYNIKRADVYLINHSETYVKYRKIVNREFNKLEEYYNKNWKNLFTSGKIYLSSFKEDIKKAFLVQGIDADGKKTYSFLPSYFVKSIRDMQTWTDLWKKAREYAGAFYKDLKETPLGGPLLTLEIYLAKLGVEVDKIKDKFKGWILSAEIYGASLKQWLSDGLLTARIKFASMTQYVKDNYKDWILSARIYFSYYQKKIKEAVIKTARDIIVLYDTYNSVLNKIKFLKFSWEGLNLAREKVDELIEATGEMQKMSFVFTQFGEEAGEAFSRFATKASLDLGELENDIIDAGITFNRLGLGNQSIAGLTELSHRLANLNPGSSFSSIKDSFAEAIKSGSAEGLGELIGGGRGLERKMRSLHLDRMLRKGDIKGFTEAFKQLADSVGYTQEKSDALDNTLNGKLKKLRSNIEQLLDETKEGLLSRLEPYIDKVLDFVTSSEFQGFFQKTIRQIYAIIDIVGTIVSRVVDVGLAIYKWWIEPASGWLRQLIGIVAMFMLFRRIIAIVHVLSIGFTVLRVTISLVRHPIKAIIKGFIRAKNEADKFFKKVRDDASIMSGVASALVTGAVVGASFLYRTVTGESHGMIEDFIRVVVPGFVYGWGMVRNFVFGVFNDIKTYVGATLNAIVKAIEAVINNMIHSLMTGFNPILETVYNLIDFTSDITGKGKSLIPRVEFDIPQFEDIHIKTDDELMKEAEDALSTVLGWKDTVLDAFGLNTKESYEEEWAKLQQQLDQTNDNLGHIRKNTKAMDLLWMKELAEQRFVNNVNVRQLTPTINVKVSGSNSSPQDIGNTLAAELQQMAEAGTFNAYGAKA